MVCIFLVVVLLCSTDFGLLLRLISTCKLIFQSLLSTTIAIVTPHSLRVHTISKGLKLRQGSGNESAISVILSICQVGSLIWYPHFCLCGMLLLLELL